MNNSFRDVHRREFQLKTIGDLILFLNNLKWAAGLVVSAGQSKPTTSPADDRKDVIINSGLELVAGDVKHWGRSSIGCNRP
ncbi:hypothetical protein GBA52_015723 [Prunus armeniaca]|nr:hypothetical protein GBA52_015723 [Prunus armeniaca]